MYLIELFNRATQWEYEHVDSTGARASFTIGDLVYRVYMEKGFDYEFELGGPLETFPNMWDINFSVAPSTSQGDGDGEEDGITGSGNAIAVFSTVIDIVKSVVYELDLQNLYFTSSDESRTKLYNRMAKQFVNKGWRYIDEREMNARSSGVKLTDTTSFLLTKQPHPHSQLRGTKTHD